MLLQNQPNLHVYRANQSKALEPREQVRKRPSLYIGGTDEQALHNMVWEVLDDAISEFENTVYNEITITLLPDNTIRIEDNGLGFPVEMSESGESQIERYMTNISRGGRAWMRQAQLLASGGLAGVGVSTINALSAFCQVEVKRDGYLWAQFYAAGRASSALEQLMPLGEGEGTGTSITFQADFSLLDENDFDFYLIAEHCRELAAALPQLRFTIQDLRGSGLSVSYYFPEGLEDWQNEPKAEKIVVEALNFHHDLVFSSNRGSYEMIAMGA
jgi:DNA gyrase subunit B